MKFRALALAPVAACVLLVLGSCGGGGGGGESGPETPAETLGVFSGFSDGGNLNWESTGGGDGGGVGDGGASGDGGVGAGGDFGQFRGANACVYLDNGTLLGCAPTDAVKGMVTIKPGRAYRGGLRIELSGSPTATYYEEGRDIYVPFPADRKIRVWVPAINRNIGITPFTEAAYRLLTEGSAPESVGSGIAPTAPSTLTRAQVDAANRRVRDALNEHFPSALHVDDIARLPFIKSQGLPAGSMRTDPRGRYGLVNGAFSKQASFHHSDTATPTLDAMRQLGEDLLDGRIDGRNGDQPAGRIDGRTYDPQTLTGELSSALAEQAARFGAQEALDVLPRVVNFGNVRYEGYLFDGSISTGGQAFSTVAGWVAENTKGFANGQQFDRLPGRRALALYGNNAHGGGFYKTDALGPRHKVFAIGDNVNGELGTGARTSTSGAAVEITLPGALTHAAGGFAHTVMRMADGAVYTLGDNTFGQLGQGEGPLALPGTTTPLRVTLPRAALAVAATNMASYALLDDGSVWSWGHNGGFGLLGNGARDGMQTTPAAVPGLTQVVQISARDNDVVVLKRDQTVWHWGSFPADEVAFDAGDPSSAYRGGTMSPVQVQVQAPGLPAGVSVRKVITEQGVFAMLLSNGHVYQWGVYFDITAGAVLRDLTAGRVLGVPPLRDLMPGGFVGYGVRPFDRLTAMGVDYRGGMWKIRGRVAEAFDPQNPAAQHRPQNQGPRLDCHSCHTFLDQSLVDLRAAAPQVPAGAPECVIPISAHRSDTGSLVHAETECVQCHNASRLNYPVLTPSGRMPFADSGGWVNCVRPGDLPNRNFIAPPSVSSSCTVPPQHVFTPPGTVCATCHNSVIARPLNDASLSCAQPQASELPTLPTTARIEGSVTDAGATLASGALSNDRTPDLRGTLSAPLGPNQQLAISRNGAAAGAAAVTGTTWRFLDSAGDGTHRYTARVVTGNGFGATSNAFTLRIDGTAPSATAAVAEFVDDALGTVAIGGFLSDSTPRLNGTLAGTLAADEVVQVLRNDTVVGTATLGTGTWSFTEPSPLAAGPHSYRARVADAAGNLGTPSTPASVTLLASLPGAAITQAVNAGNAVVANGGTTNDTRPTFSGTLGATLPAGAVLRVLRDGTARGAAAVGAGGLSWTFQEPGATDGTYSYVVRAEAGVVLGTPSSAYDITIDTVAPTQRADVVTVADDVNGVLAGANPTTADTTPTVSGTLTAALGSGDRLQILRNGGVVATLAPFAGTAWSYTEPTPVPITPPATQVTLLYAARVIDEASQTGPATGATRQVTVAPGSVPLVNAGTTITAVAGISVPVGGATVGSVYTTTPVVSGTIARALAADEQLVIYRNTTSPVVAPSRGGSAAQVGFISAATLGTSQSWAFTSGALTPGATYFFSANIEKTANPLLYGAPSATSGVPVVTATTGAVGGIFDDANVTVAGNNTADSTPRIAGTLGRALASGETLRLFRAPGAAAGVAVTPSGTNWTYTEPAGLGVGAYSYTVRIVDAANVPGAQSAASTVNVIATLPAASTIAGPVPVDNVVFDTTPTVTGTLGAVLPTGASVRLYRPTGAGACNAATFNTGSCPLVNSGGSVGSAAWSITDANIGNGQRRYVARVENGTAYGSTSGEYRLTVASAPTASISTATTSVMPNTTVTGASPNGNGIANGGLTNDNSPRVQVQFSAALGTGTAMRIRRNGSIVTPTAIGSCGTNCFIIELPSPVSLVNNEGGTLAGGTPSAAGLPSGPWSYTAMAVDAGGNEGTASGGFSFSFGYHGCDFTRADARYRAFNSNNPHPAWASLNCSTCHTATSATNPTPAGTLVRVPAGISAPTAPTPSYWCRRP